jgi:hypothetical protein
MKPRVYIAGKLNAIAPDYIKNVHNMIVWADQVRKLGASVYVPCIDFVMGMVMGNYEYADYFDNSQPWLAAAEAVFVCPGWETSEGTRKEIALAIALGKPVFYDIDAVSIFVNMKPMVKDKIEGELKNG